MKNIGPLPNAAPPPRTPPVKRPLDLPNAVKCPECDWWANWTADFVTTKRYRCPECGLRFELRYLT